MMSITEKRQQTSIEFFTCRTPTSSAIRAQSPVAAVDPFPRAKSINGPTLHDVGNKVVAAVAATEDEALEVISLKEVAENESWMVIYDKVYDLTEFFREVIARIRLMLSTFLALTVVNLLFFSTLAALRS